MTFVVHVKNNFDILLTNIEYSRLLYVPFTMFENSVPQYAFLQRIQIMLISLTLEMRHDIEYIPLKKFHKSSALILASLVLLDILS